VSEYFFRPVDIVIAKDKKELLKKSYEGIKNMLNTHLKFIKKSIDILKNIEKIKKDMV